MGRRLRFIPPDSLVEVTCRTIQGRFLLQPRHRCVELCRGVLARAVRLYPVELHAFVFLGNHYHLLLTCPNAERLAQFMNYLNSNLAREIGRAVSWREKFWGRRYQAIPVSAEESAQVERLLYILRQGTKEGLVRRPQDWPGASSMQALLTGNAVRGPWIDRSLEHAQRRRGVNPDPRSFVFEESFSLTPLPCWKGASEAEYRRRIQALVKLVRKEGTARESLLSRAPLGPEGILRQNPHDAPVHQKRGPAPLVHAASREVRQAFRETYRQFVTAFRRASEKFRARGAWIPLLDQFPPGSFVPRGPFLDLARAA